MGKGKDHKFEIIMHYNSNNSGSAILDQLVRALTCIWVHQSAGLWNYSSVWLLLFV